MNDLRSFFEANYAALSRRDVDAWLESFTEDAELHELPEIPDSDVYRGHQGIRRWAEQTLEHVEEWEWSLEDLHAGAGDIVVTQAHISLLGAGSGVPLEMEAFHVTKMRDGKIAKIQGFTDRATAYATGGVDER